MPPFSRRAPVAAREVSQRGGGARRGSEAAGRDQASGEAASGRSRTPVRLNGAQIPDSRGATLELRADIERSLQAGLRLPEIRQFREVPMEPETEDVELESVPVGRPSVDQLVRARVPEPELLVLQRRSPDVHEKVPPDVAQAGDGESQVVDEREPELEVRVRHRVADLLAEIEPPQRIETAEIVDRREIAGRARPEETHGEERPCGDLEVVPQIDREVLRQRGGVGRLVGVGIDLPLLQVRRPGDRETATAN